MTSETETIPPRRARFAHTNLVARDWRKLARFYEEVFGCTPVPPQRSQSGRWLAEGTGVADAKLEGMHLRLPGHGPDGPTLELYRYDPVRNCEPTAANLPGFRHIAFEVEDVAVMERQVLDAGGTSVGQITCVQVPEVGELTFVYVADPEGNLIELQSWSEGNRRQESSFRD